MHPHNPVLQWADYDPSWLVALARAQEPADEWLAEALAGCTRAAWECEAYLRFVEPRTSAPFLTNVILGSTPQGDLVLDVSRDRAVPGVEFLSRL
jgi:hypothetical protein